MRSSAIVQLSRARAAIGPRLQPNYWPFRGLTGIRMVGTTYVVRVTSRAFNANVPADTRASIVHRVRRGRRTKRPPTRKKREVIAIEAPQHRRELARSIG